MIALTGLLAPSACAIKQPIMVLPAGLRDGGEVWPVSGRNGFHLWNHDISFGPFRTAETRAGLRSDDSTNWGVLDKNEDWEAKRPVSFVLEGETCARWTARCMGEAHRRHREKAVGIGTNANGSLGIARKTVVDEAGSSFECKLAANDGPEWRMSLSAADESGFGGVLVDHRGATVARIRATDQTGSPYPYAVQSPVGFVIETGYGDAAAIERAFDGKVILGRATPDGARCPIAGVAAALLLWEPL